MERFVADENFASKKQKNVSEFFKNTLRAQTGNILESHISKQCFSVCVDQHCFHNNVSSFAEVSMCTLIGISLNTW